MPADRIDDTIREALAEVIQAVGADRGAVDIRARRISWARPGVATSPGLDARYFPWSLAQLNDTGVVRFSRTAELPEAASTDRAAYEGAGTRAAVSVSIRSDRPGVDVLTVEAVDAHSIGWPDEVVEWLRRVGDAFAGALARTQEAASLAIRLALEQMRSSLSARLTAITAANFDREIERALGDVVSLVGLDHAALVELVPDGTSARCWSTSGPLRVDEELPWTIAALRRGEVVSCACLGDLPDEAAVDRGTWAARGIKAQLGLPVLVGGHVVGALVFGALQTPPPWAQQHHLEAFPLVGEVFGNALSRHQGERQIQRLRQDLAHIGRVSAMGVLTASLAHELNQPLTAILNNAQVVQRLLGAEIVDVAEVREILADIVADDKRAAAVIGRLRLLLRKGELEYVSVDLNEVVTEIARLVTSDVVTRNVSLHLDLDAGLPRVRGDRGQLQQVVLNLVLNGLDALQAPGSDGRLVVRTFRASESAVGVAVCDSGPGIAGPDAAQIFEPLYTTKPEGLGMGLAIARTIAGAHGGRLVASNNAGRGATFELTLPAEGPAA